MSLGLTLLAALAPLAAQSAEGSAAPPWPDFPAFVWRLRYRDAEPPAELLAGFSGVDVKRGEDAGWARDRELDVYLGHAPGRDDLHLDADDPRWREPWDAWVASDRAGEPGSDAEPIRVPSLSDPATRARLEATLEATLARHADVGGLFASLGDEVSMTPSQGIPWDGCRGPHSREAWATYSGGRPMPTTDAARRAWTAGNTAELGDWLALRRFHRSVVEDEVLHLAERARELSPGLPLGLLGTIGATPFGGVDLARLIRELDVIECYADGDARADVETLRTLDGARPLRSLRTVFVADDTADGAAWQVSEHFVRGGDGVVLWCDAELEDAPAHAARTRAAVALVRRLERDLAPAPPAPRGVAVLRDDDSRALAFLAEARLDGRTWPNRFPSYQARHGTVEPVVEGWLRLFEDLGHHPGVVRFATLDASRFPVVVFPHVAVTDDRDAAVLDDFLGAGGIALLEGELGTHDRDGKARRTSLAERLREDYPDQILAVSIEGYLSRRLTMDSARRRALLPAAARAALSARGQAPIPITSEGGLPWLVTSTPLAGGSLLVRAVPNLTSFEERRGLVDARLAEPSPPPGFELVWHHPAQGAGATTAGEAGERVLPAGDPLLFELRPLR